MLPTIKTLAPNFTLVELGNSLLWFSYETLIAFHVVGDRRVVRENIWGKVTGKHLNIVDRGSERVDSYTFEVKWAEAQKLIRA